MCILEPLKNQSESWRSPGKVLEICFWKRVRTLCTLMLTESDSLSLLAAFASNWIINSPFRYSQTHSKCFSHTPGSHGQADRRKTYFVPQPVENTTLHFFVYVTHVVVGFIQCTDSGDSVPESCPGASSSEKGVSWTEGNYLPGG